MNRLLLIPIAAILLFTVGFVILNDEGNAEEQTSYSGPFVSNPDSGEVSLLETQGGKATFVATPYPGSAFKGWYDTDGNQLSAMLSITVDEGQKDKLIARFGAYTNKIMEFDWYLPIMDDDGRELSTVKNTFSVAVSDEAYYRSILSIDVSRQSTSETPMPNHLLRDDSVINAIVQYLTPLTAGMNDRDKAAVINAFVQDIIEYATDKTQYGRPEFWTTAYETIYSGYGDCEDTATLFVNIALRMGLKAGYVAFDRSTMGHMSAAVEIGDTGSFKIGDRWFVYVETAVDSSHVPLGSVPTSYTIDEGKWTEVIYENGVYTTEDTIPINPTASRYGGTDVIYVAKYTTTENYGKDVSEYLSNIEIDSTGVYDGNSEYGETIYGATEHTMKVGQHYSFSLRSGNMTDQDELDIGNGMKLINKGVHTVFIDTRAIYLEGTPLSVGTKQIELGGTTYTLTYVQEFTVGIHYEANGGEGSIADDTVTKQFSTPPSGSESFTIKSGSGLSRDGYDFLGWSTNSSASSANSIYAPGKAKSVSYSSTDNPNLFTLYAVWGKVIKPTSISASNYTRGTDSGPTTVNISFTPYNTANKNVTATSSNEYVVVATGGNGKVVFMPGHPGTATITVTCEADTSVTTTFTVTIKQTETSTMTYKADGTTVSTDTSSSYSGSFQFTITSYQPTVSDGRVFVGWIDDGGSSLYTGGDTYTTSSRSITMVAVFKNVFTLKFSDTGSTSISNLTGRTDGSSYEFTIPNTVPIKAGFEFDGWSLTSGGPVNRSPGDKITVTTSDPNKTVTLYAVWAPIYTFTLHFDTDGGSPVGDITKNSRETTVTFTSGELASAVSSKDGYVFNGWFQGDVLKISPNGGSFRTSNTNETLTAGWLKIYINQIHFAGKDDTMDNWPTDMSADRLNTSYSTTFSMPEDPAKEDYMFLGWSEQGSSVMKKHGDSITVTNGQTIILYPNWLLIHKTGIRYQLDNGEDDWYNPHKGNDGTIICMVTSSIPEKQYMEFKGWKGQDDEFYTAGETILVDEGDTFIMTAQWEPIRIPVTYVSIQDPYTAQVLDTDMGHVTRLPEQPERNWYRFTGWYLDKECTERYDVSSIVLEPFTVYAGWNLTGKAYTSEPYAKMTIKNTNIDYEYMFDASMFSRDYYEVKWEFSDGRTSDDLTVTRVMDPGMYSVKLILTNNVGTTMEERFFGIAADGSPVPYKEEDNSISLIATGLTIAVSLAVVGLIVWRRGI